MTKKQIDAWLKVKLNNYLYMIDKRGVVINQDMLFDIYSQFVDKIYD